LIEIVVMQRCKAVNELVLPWTDRFGLLGVSITKVSSGVSMRAALATMLALDVQDHNDGSFRLFTAACRCVEHNLSDHEACVCLSAYALQRPFPNGFTDQELLKRVRDAETATQRGKAIKEAVDMFRQVVRGLLTGQRMMRRKVLTKRRTELTNVQEHLFNGYLGGTINEPMFQLKSADLKSQIEDVRRQLDDADRFNPAFGQTARAVFNFSQNLARFKLAMETKVA
jgi:hypothetical protein